jgi:hypothetical protein
MSLSNVQAQLGNLLAAMPLKVQKVSPSFLDSSTPPFEGAIASDESGQFYMSLKNAEGNLVWQPILDKLSSTQASASEVLKTHVLPVGFESSTIAFGKELQGDSFSVFVQIETPDIDDITMYATSVSGITSQQFNLHISDSIRTEGYKAHIYARGYGQ